MAEPLVFTRRERALRSALDAVGPKGTGLATAAYVELVRSIAEWLLEDPVDVSPCEVGPGSVHGSPERPLQWGAHVITEAADGVGRGGLRVRRYAVDTDGSLTLLPPPGVPESEWQEQHPEELVDAPRAMAADERELLRRMAAGDAAELAEDTLDDDEEGRARG